MMKSSALLFFATQSGGTTLDTGEGGGNPFASALIELAEGPPVPLRQLAGRLRTVTSAKSRGHQITQCIGSPRVPAWTFAENLGRRREKRLALVLIVSDYSRFRSGASLEGAARDERRVAGMLARQGFSVTQGVGPSRRELTDALIAFGRQSKSADVAVIYSTGHGVEHNGLVHLLPGDYPAAADLAGNLKRAIRVNQLVDAAKSRGQNLIFFAGCRTHASRF